MGSLSANEIEQNLSHSIWSAYFVCFYSFCFRHFAAIQSGWIKDQFLSWVVKTNTLWNCPPTRDIYPKWLFEVESTRLFLTSSFPLDVHEKKCCLHPNPDLSRHVPPIIAQQFESTGFHWSLWWNSSTKKAFISSTNCVTVQLWKSIIYVIFQ